LNLDYDFFAPPRKRRPN